MKEQNAIETGIGMTTVDACKETILQSLKDAADTMKKATTISAILMTLYNMQRYCERSFENWYGHAEDKETVDWFCKVVDKTWKKEGLI